jgi:hypothetical protein
VSWPVVVAQDARVMASTAASGQRVRQPILVPSMGILHL